jgi:hypothetical protein
LRKQRRLETARLRQEWLNGNAWRGRSNFCCL